MKVWDLHCDTLSELRYAEREGHPKDFAHNDLMLDLERMRRGDYLLQCMACYVCLDPEREKDPLVACLEEIDVFNRLLDRYADQVTAVRTPEDIRALRGSGRIGLMLTVEEGGVCRDSLGVLRDLHRLGVRMMTLTWNFRNGLAEPNFVQENRPNTEGGLTPRGVEFVREMERLRMIPDVSHLSDAGILDVLRYTTRPFAASHSNARGCCPHVRNLTDEMLHAMGERGCLIGLNYCPSFLDANPDPARRRSRISDMARQVRYLIDHAGEDCIALGSDFDGIDGDLEIAGAQDLPRLAEGLQREGIPERVVEKLFSGNAERFFTENL